MSLSARTSSVFWPSALGIGRANSCNTATKLVGTLSVILVTDAALHAASIWRPSQSMPTWLLSAVASALGSSLSVLLIRNLQWNILKIKRSREPQEKYCSIETISRHRSLSRDCPRTGFYVKLSVSQSVRVQERDSDIFQVKRDKEKKCSVEFRRAIVGYGSKR